MIAVYNSRIDDSFDVNAKLYQALYEYLKKTHLPIPVDDICFCQTLTRRLLNLRSMQSLENNIKLQNLDFFSPPTNDFPIGIQENNINLYRIFAVRNNICGLTLIPSCFYDLVKYKIISFSYLDFLVVSLLCKKSKYFKGFTPIGKDRYKHYFKLLRLGMSSYKDMCPVNKKHWFAYSLNTIRKRFFIEMENIGKTFVYNVNKEYYEWIDKDDSKKYEIWDWKDEVNTWTPSQKNLYNVIKNFPLKENSEGKFL